VVVVQDGAPELWNLVEEWFANFNVPIEMKLLDRYHLDERLAEIAEILERDKRDRRRLLETWRASLDRGDGAIRRICKQIEDRSYREAPPATTTDDDPDAIHPFGDDFDWEPDPIPRFARHSTNIIEGHLGYCANNKERMKYATARKRGFPIGSGVTEGACKSVIACRLKRSGQRWFESGASACLQLRTLHLNGRLKGGFDIYVEHRRGMLVEA